MKFRQRTLMFLSAALMTLGLYAQDLQPDVNEKGKFGYVNSAGAVVIKYDYAEAGPFENGLAKVKKGKKYGYINEQGQPVGKIKYSYVMPFVNGYSRVAVGGKTKDGIFDGGKWGFIDRNGNEVVPPVYDEIGNFVNGFAYIMKGSKYGLVSEDCRIVLQAENVAVGEYDKNGLCWYAKSGKVDDKGNLTDAKYGLLSQTGQVLEPKYKSLGYFYSIDMGGGDKADFEASGEVGNMNFFALRKKNSQLYNENCFLDAMLISAETDAQRDSITRQYGYVKVSAYDGYIYAIEKEGRFAVFSQDGKKVFEDKSVGGAYCPVDGVILAYYGSDDNKNYFYYNIDTQKSFSFGTEYTLSSFSYGLGRVEHKGNKSVFFVNKHGDMVTPTYPFANKFEDGICVVRDAASGKVGVIDNNGRNVIEFKYDDAQKSFSEGYLGVSLKGKWGVIDKNDKSIVPFKYAFVTNVSNGWVGAKDKSGKFGYINLDSEIMVPFIWDDLKIISEKEPRYVWGKKENKWYCYDREKKGYAFEKCFDNVNNFEDGLATVILDNKYGKINTKGETVVVPVLDSASELQQALLYMEHLGKKKMTETDILRMKIYADPTVNGYRITDTIPSEKWDF